MLTRFSVFLIVLLACFAFAGDAKAQDTAELTRVFDEYNSVAKVGDIKKMLPLRTLEQQKDIKKGIAGKQERDYFLLISRAQIPESYQVQHVTWSKNGRDARLYLLAQLPAMRELDRPRSRAEEMISFKKEGGKWKIHLISALGDPDKIKHPKDLNYNPKDADTNVSGQLGGRIVKTEYFPEYTLVLVRVMDEENAVFLPPKEEILEAGASLEDFTPWKVHQFSGYPHKSDKQKFFATSGQPVEE